MYMDLELAKHSSACSMSRVHEVYLAKDLGTAATTVSTFFFIFIGQCSLERIGKHFVP